MQGTHHVAQRDITAILSFEVNSVILTYSPSNVLRLISGSVFWENPANDSRNTDKKIKFLI